jgi:hypothetical protein
MSASTSPESGGYEDAEVKAFRLAVIIGGVAEDAEGDAGEWFMRRVEAGADTDPDGVFDLAEMDTPVALGGFGEAAAWLTVRRRVDAAGVRAVGVPGGPGVPDGPAVSAGAIAGARWAAGVAGGRGAAA